MNKPAPALDENGEFVVAKLRNGETVPIFTLYGGFANYPILGRIGGAPDSWTAAGAYVDGKESGSDILNLAELRATVERARKMREPNHDDGCALNEGTHEASCDCSLTRPTFAEALEEECRNEANKDDGQFDYVTYGELRDMIMRARRASEG